MSHQRYPNILSATRDDGKTRAQAIAELRSPTASNEHVQGNAIADLCDNVISTSNFQGARLSTNPDANHQIFWKLDEASGTNTFANSGAAGATQTLTKNLGGAGTLAHGRTMPWGSVAPDNMTSSSDPDQIESSLTTYQQVLPITFEAWCYPLLLPATDAVEWIAIKQYRNDNSWSDPWIALGLAIKDHRATFVITNGTSGSGTYREINSTSNRAAFAVARANHIGLTYDGVTFIGYLNGYEVVRQAQTQALDYNGASGGLYRLGSRPVGSERFRGLIWDVAISDIARPASYFSSVFATGLGWA